MSASSVITVWRIAFRNLREHKVKTLIIGVMIALGITVLVIGNSLMDTAALGIQRTYIDNYTGHLMVTGAHQGLLTLFGPQSMDTAQTEPPQIPEFDAVLEYAMEHPGILAVNPQATATASLSFGEEGRGFTYLFGIDPDRYRTMFSENVEIVEGEFLKPGQQGILISETVLSMLEESSEQTIGVGDHVLLTRMSMVAGVKIREVEVVGIFRFVRSDPQLDMVSLIDIQNLRALAGMTLTGEKVARLSAEEQALLGEIDEENLFGGEDVLFGGLVEEISPDSQLLLDDPLFLTDPFASDLEVSRGEGEAEGDSGAWHFLLLKLRNPESIEAVRADFEAFFAENGIDAQLSDWTEGAGMMAEMASSIKLVFNVIVMVIAVAAVIIIMNTLVISVTERIAEIGTMRAIGAQKSFIIQMITYETIIVCGVFGILGVAIGAAILGILGITGIQAPNELYEVILGGEVLHPVVSLSSVAMSLVIVTAIGVLSSFYPVVVALKIEPVRAMQSS